MARKQVQEQPEGMPFAEWLEQLKRMPGDTPFALHFDFTLGRGQMRKNLENMGWAFDIKTGKWTPPAEGAKP